MSAATDALLAGPAAEPALRRLAELVALDTVSPLDAERLAGARALLAAHGCRPLGTRLLGRGDPTSPLWVYAHLDTKPPVPREAWRTDPFALVPADGELYGLGVSDAKFQLLNALEVAPRRGCFLLVDTGEECGEDAAAELMRAHRIDTLVVVDGAAGAHDVYNGLSGQADGVLHLSTRRARLHPGRERVGAEAGAPALLELLAALHAETRAARWRFHVTGLAAEHSERSLTLEHVAVRFDLRFDDAARSGACAFLDARDCELRQWMEPLEGRERFTAARLRTGGPAPFSSSLGGRGLDLRRVVVVPGGRNEDGAHRPNEHASRPQIAAHRARLAAVLAALGAPPDA